MKRFLIVSILLMGFGIKGFSATPVYDGYLVNGIVVSTMTPTINVSTISGDYVSLQLNFSTPTYISSIFNDGVKSTGTITIKTNASVRGSTLTIQSNSYVEGNDWSYNATYSSMSALNLFTILNSTFGVYASGYLTVLSTYSLTNSSVVVNGKTFKESTDWFVQTTATGTAKALTTAIGNYWNGVLLAQWSTNKVNLTACVYGVGGNDALTSWVSTITVSAAAMTGGKIAPLSGIVFDSSSVNALSLIRATATVVGASGNYTFVSSTPAITITGMAGGAASQVLYAPYSTIYSTQNYLAGLSVLFTVTAGSAPLNLQANTTYFVIPYNSTSLRLASTRDNAIAGVSLPLSNTTNDRGTFVLTAITPSTYTPCGLVWQGSNDGVSYWNLSVVSATIVSTSPWTTQNWDIGKYDYEYIRAYITPAISTLGSVFVQIIGYITKIAQ